ncbi:MAG TPA: glycosyltransferase family 2 protein [Pyrinomonadaceae bacterium]|nr:glycosyltransferase family 2 protein [Pyrinomonadaceae bacterium]
MNLRRLSPLLLVTLSWVIFCAWLLGGALTLLSLARHKPLIPSVNSNVRAWPLVSVLVPARNEEHRILRACLRSILAQDYDDFEVVAVNDRSTDSTLAILHSIAERDARLRVLDGTETPEGWLGKPHALRQALDNARGEWLLSTDADMLFHASALRTAVEYVSEKGCDALTFLPRFEALSFWERVFVPVWLWGGLILFPPEIVNRLKSRMAVGVGGFFLIRRAALERAGGFESVRAEVLEDMRLAEVLKRSGARLHVLHAPALVSTRMYTNLSELWESSAKNWFAILRFSVTLTLAMLAWMFFVAVLPPALAVLSALALAVGSTNELWPRLLLPNALTWALFISLLALVNRRFGVPARYALTAPLGWLLSCAVMLASAQGVLTGRGLTWKGRRFYHRAGVRPPRARG